MVVTLAPGEVIEGVLQDAAGQPVAGHVQAEWQHVETGPDGRFRFEGMPARVSLRA